MSTILQTIWYNHPLQMETLVTVALFFQLSVPIYLAGDRAKTKATA